MCPQILYCKLFLVFGISWSLEPVNMALSVFFNQNQVAQGFATVTSVLNLLRGFFIFLVFVSPANVKKYMHGTRRTGLHGTSSKSTTTSSTSLSRTTLVKKFTNKLSKPYKSLKVLLNTRVTLTDTGLKSKIYS